jgi:hypothetical protein
MAPEEIASRATIARLRADIAEERRALARCTDDLADASSRLAAAPSDRAALVFAAFALHGWYTGFEAIAERVARQLDGSIPMGDRWHRDLLSQISVEVPGVRPAVVPRALISDLAALLGFRQFFRHSYGVDLEFARLDLERSRLQRILPTIAASLDAFDAFLAGAVTSE